MATPLAALVDASARAAQTTRRLAKRDAIAACLRVAGASTDADDVEIAVAYLSGEIRQGRIGIGWATLATLRGTPALEPRLTLRQLDAALGEVAATAGKGSGAARRAMLRSLFDRATAAEQDFVLRLLVGELRQGALEGVMLDAIAAAAGLAAAEVRRAAMLTGDLGSVARIAISEAKRHRDGDGEGDGDGRNRDRDIGSEGTPTASGTSSLARLAVALHRPVQPMLATPAADMADAMARLGTAALEWKVDGARVQVHKAGGTVKVYTRALKEVTDSVPEIVEALQALPAPELILDGEAVALRADGSPLPFQVTMRRFGRKLDVAGMRAELPLSAVFFDCLHAGGRSLLDAPAHERFDALAAALPAALVIPRLVTADLGAAEDFYAAALAKGHEGVMAKALAAPYEAGRRGAGWLKVKRAHTLDLVVLAAEWGHGRRKGWLSNLHLGARDADGAVSPSGWVMLGKTFKGMTDALLDWQTRELLARELRRDGHVVRVRPELVVEIAFNDLQTSPQYPGGLALRFARVKGYRPDKPAAEADTIETVRQLHAAQLAESRVAEPVGSTGG